MITNRKGLSDVVTTVLIILLVIVAIGTIWTIVQQPIKNAGTQAGRTEACLNTQIEVVSCAKRTASTQGNVTVRVVQGSPANVKLVLEGSNGATTVTADKASPATLATSFYTFLDTEAAAVGQPIRVGAAAVVNTPSGTFTCAEAPRVACA